MDIETFAAARAMLAGLPNQPVRKVARPVSKVIKEQPKNQPKRPRPAYEPTLRFFADDKDYAAANPELVTPVIKVETFKLNLFTKAPGCEISFWETWTLKQAQEWLDNCPAGVLREVRYVPEGGKVCVPFTHEKLPYNQVDKRK